MMTKTAAYQDEEKLLDFEVVNEEWNKYELEDETILKMKFVLVNLIQKGAVKKGVHSALFTSEIVAGVFSPRKLRGPSGRKYTVDELKQNIIQRNLKFRQTLDAGWNEYKLEKTILQVRNILRSVDRTSLFDSAGMPAYMINFESLVSIKPIGETTERARTARSQG